MKRRKFILLAIVGSAAAGFPIIACNTAQKSLYPEFLHSLVDRSVLIEVGRLYLQKFPQEADKTKLEQHILGGQKPSSPRVFLQEKVKADFQNGKIVVLSGWVLSITEARQLALLNLTS
jgi:hypothetical protein